MTRRTERAGDEVRRILAEIIQRKLDDPRLQGVVSLTDVIVSRDLSTARVFYSVYGGEDKSESVRQAFRSAGPFLRHALSEQLRARRTPRLIFEEDVSIRKGERMDDLIRRVREKDLLASVRRNDGQPEDRPDDSADGSDDGVPSDAGGVRS